MSRKNTIGTRRTDSQSGVDKKKNKQNKNKEAKRKDQKQTKNASRSDEQRTGLADIVIRQNEAEKEQKPDDVLFRNGKALRLSLIALGVLVLFGMSIYKLPRIKHFEVEGNTDSTAEEVIDACGVIYGQHIFETNLNAVKLNLTSNAKYRNVSVEYKFLSTLKITLNESEADARISKNNKDIVIDRNGLVIYFGQLEEKQNIPQVLGLSVNGYKEGSQLSVSDEYQLWVLKQTLNTLYDSGFGNTYALIDLSNSVDIKMMNYKRVTVHFGELNNLEEKLKRADLFLNELDEEGITGGVLDVSSKQNTYRPVSSNEIFVPEEWNQWLPPDLGIVTLNNSTDSNENGNYIASDIPSGTDSEAQAKPTEELDDLQINLDPTPESSPEPTPSPKPSSTPKKTEKNSNQPKPQKTVDPIEALGIPDELAQ